VAIGPLARGKGGAVSTPDHGYGWPPRMLMKVACAYTGRSRWALARAVREGRLPIAGRNGRSPVFDRAALDSFMVGEPLATRHPDRRTTTNMTGGSAAALERLQRVARGGAR